MHFVLVHGAWHNGTAWDQVVEFLKAAGHTTYAPTLLDCGPTAARRSYPLAEMVQNLADDIVRRDFNNFVLVAHSAGGPVIQHITQLLPWRIRRLVFVLAMVLWDGDNYIKSVHEDLRNSLIQASWIESGDPAAMLPFEVFREMFTNTVDLETSKRIYGNLSPQGSQAFAEYQDLKAFLELRMPSSYINLTTYSSRMSSEGFHPTFSSGVGLYRLVDMPGDHEAMYTSPELLAKKIIEAGQD